MMTAMAEAKTPRAFPHGQGQIMIRCVQQIEDDGKDFRV